MLNGEYYLHINLTTKSQLLQSDYSHYNSYQEFLYNLVNTLKDRGLGYRKIAHKLNSDNIRTHRGKEWYSNNVYSVLKRYKEREERIKYKNKKYEPTYSKMWVE